MTHPQRGKSSETLATCRHPSQPSSPPSAFWRAPQNQPAVSDCLLVHAVAVVRNRYSSPRASRVAKYDSAFPSVGIVRVFHQLNDPSFKAGIQFFAKPSKDLG